MRRLVLCLALLWPGLAWADPPQAVLTGPSRVEPGGLILLSPSGTVSDEPPRIVPEAGMPAALATTPLYTPGPDGTFQPFAALATAPSAPGLYRFACVAVSRDGAEPAYSVATWQVTVGVVPEPPKPPGPTTEPEPPPAPDPPPDVVAGTLHVSYITDPRAITPAQASIKTDPAVRQAMASMDAIWRTFDSDEEDVKRLNFDGHAAAVGYPALLVQDQAGKVVAKAKVDSPQRVVEIVGRLRGNP